MNSRNEIVIVVGKITREPSFKEIGDKKLPLTTISIALDKNEYMNLNLYGYDFSEEVKELRVGDLVMATGELQVTTNKGKTFKNLSVRTIHKSL